MANQKEQKRLTKVWEERDKHVQAFRALSSRKEKVLNELLRKCSILLRSEKELKNAIPFLEQKILGGLRDPDAVMPRLNVSKREYVKAQMQSTEERVERLFKATHSMIDFISFVSANEPEKNAETAWVGSISVFDTAAAAFQAKDEEYVEEVKDFLQYHDIFQRFYSVEVRDQQGKSYGHFGQYGWSYIAQNLKSARQPATVTQAKKLIPSANRPSIKRDYFRIKKYLLLLEKFVMFMQTSAWAPRPVQVRGRSAGRTPEFGRRQYEEEAEELTPQDREVLRNFRGQLHALIAKATASGGPEIAWKQLKAAAQEVKLAHERLNMTRQPIEELRQVQQGGVGVYPPDYTKYLEWGEHLLEVIQTRAKAWSENLEHMVRFPGVSDFRKLVLRLIGRIERLKTDYDEAKSECQQYLAEYKALYTSAMEARDVASDEVA